MARLFTHTSVLPAQDLLALLGAFGSADAAADGNGDGEVNVVDLLALLGDFGNSCADSGAIPLDNPDFEANSIDSYVNMQSPTLLPVQVMCVKLTINLGPGKEA